MASQGVVDLVAKLRSRPTCTNIELQLDWHTHLQLNLQDVALLVDATPPNSCISELRLCVDLSADAVAPLAAWIASLNQLTALHLRSVSKQGLCKEDAPTVRALLSKCTRLAKLQLSNMHPAMLQAVHDALAVHEGRLTSLNLSWCKMDEQHTAPLIALLNQQSALKELKLSYNRSLQPELFTELATCPHRFTSLHLANCNLDAAHTASLSAWFFMQNALVTLNLSENTCCHLSCSPNWRSVHIVSRRSTSPSAISMRSIRRR
jgi:hypothetical protein